MVVGSFVARFSPKPLELLLFFLEACLDSFDILAVEFKLLLIELKIGLTLTNSAFKVKLACKKPTFSFGQLSRIELLWCELTGALTTLIAI